MEYSSLDSSQRVVLDFIGRAGRHGAGIHILERASAINRLINFLGEVTLGRFITTCSARSLLC